MSLSFYRRQEKTAESRTLEFIKIVLLALMEVTIKQYIKTTLCEIYLY